MEQTLADRVRNLREKRGWNQQQLAKAAGLHPSHIGLIERGGRVNVRPGTLEKLAKALDVPVEFFFAHTWRDYAPASARWAIETGKAQTLGVQSRINLLVNDLWEKFGDEANPQVLLDEFKERFPEIEPVFVNLGDDLDPTLIPDFEVYGVRAVAEVLRVPLDYFISGLPEFKGLIPNLVPEPVAAEVTHYADAIKLAVQHGIGPALLRELVELAIKIRTTTTQ